MEELTPDQLEILRKRLLEEQSTLVDLLNQTQDDAAPVDLDLPIGRLSRIDAIQQQKMAEATRNRYAARLKKIEAALERVENGEYGDCEECGDYISFKRLHARPEARFCIDCKEIREQEAAEG